MRSLLSQVLTETLAMLPAGNNLVAWLRDDITSATSPEDPFMEVLPDLRTMYKKACPAGELTITDTGNERLHDRIQEVGINGIRGFPRAEDDQGYPAFNGIRPRGQNVLIYGQNGSGKSSFCDALEWALTGQLQEWKERELGNQNALLISNSAETSQLCSVKVTLRNGRRTSQRFLERVSNPVSPFEESCEDRDASYCFVNAYSVERFVLDSHSNLWNRFADLLGFEDLVTFSSGLNKFKELARQGLEETLKDQRKSQGDTRREQRDLLEAEKELVHLLKPKRIPTVLPDEDVQLDVMRKLNYLRSRDDYMASQQNTCESLRGAYEAALLKWKEAKARRPAKRKDKWEEYKYWIIKGEAKTRLQSFQQKTHETRDIYNEVLADLKSEIPRELWCQKPSDKKSVRATLVLWGNLGQARRERAIIDNLTKIIKNERIMQETAQELRSMYKALWLDARRFSKVFGDLASKAIRRELGAVSRTELTDGYNRLNPENRVQSISLNASVSEKKLSIRVRTRTDGQTIEPVDYMSTGYLRCVGFAALIARLKRQQRYRFVVIDDPIFAIDQDHRYALVEYLAELSKEYQVIITTSDRLFLDMLRHALSPSSKVYQTSADNSGVVVLGEEKPSRYIEEAGQLINSTNPDYRAACMYIRLALEHELYRLADKSKLMVEFGRAINNRIGLNQLIDDYHIEEHLSRQYQQRLSSIHDAFGRIKRDRILGNMLDSSPLNGEMHYPWQGRQVYAKAEILRAHELASSFIAHMNQLIPSRS
jgi:energy-coupling factor transporter ATP-binding protein EcfA2